MPTHVPGPFRIPKRLSVRAPLRLALAVVLVVAAVAGIVAAVRGCRPHPAGPSADETVYVPPGEGGAPTTFSGGQTSQATFSDIPVVMTARVSHLSFQGVVKSSLCPDGRSYLVNTAVQRGARKYMGFVVYDTEGRPLWEHAFTDTSYRSENAAYAAGGKVVAGEAVDYEEKGEFHLLDSAGNVLLNRPISGWTQAVVSDDGSALALINESSHGLVVFESPGYREVWSTTVGQGATGVFIGNGPRLLLLESGRARLFNAGGKVVWSVNIPGGGRWNAAVSPDQRYIAATTPDPDSTVYLYSVADGSLVWSQFLVAGGDKHLAFSPDGGSLVVYDVGQHGDIYLLKTSTGEILWRFRLQGKKDSLITVEDLQYSATGQAIIADIVEMTQAGDTYTNYHYLLDLTADGRALWISPLGAEVDVDLLAASGLALVTTNNLIDPSGNVVNSVTLISYTAEASTPPAASTTGAGGP